MSEAASIPTPCMLFQTLYMPLVVTVCLTLKQSGAQVSLCFSVIHFTTGCCSQACFELLQQSMSACPAKACSYTAPRTDIVCVCKEADHAEHVCKLVEAHTASVQHEPPPACIHAPHALRPCNQDKLAASDLRGCFTPQCSGPVQQLGLHKSSLYVMQSGQRVLYSNLY